MPTITIPKNLIKNDDLIIVPRKEYEALFDFKKIKEFTPTDLEKRALKQAEENFKQGRTLSYNELIRRLGFTS